jgi:hypothetical protein
MLSKEFLRDAQKSRLCYVLCRLSTRSRSGIFTLMRIRIRFFQSDRIRIPCLSDADPDPAPENDADHADPDLPNFSQLQRETSSLW